jgi:hypothetical protein
MTVTLVRRGTRAPRRKVGGTVSDRDRITACREPDRRRRRRAARPREQPAGPVVPRPVRGRVPRGRPLGAARHRGRPGPVRAGRADVPADRDPHPVLRRLPARGRLRAGGAARRRARRAGVPAGLAGRDPPVRAGPAGSPGVQGRCPRRSRRRTGVRTSRRARGPARGLGGRVARRRVRPGGADRLAGRRTADLPVLRGRRTAADHRRGAVGAGQPGVVRATDGRRAGRPGLARPRGRRRRARHRPLARRPGCHRAGLVGRRRSRAPRPPPRSAAPRTTTRPPTGSSPPCVRARRSGRARRSHPWSGAGSSRRAGCPAARRRPRCGPA